MAQTFAPNFDGRRSILAFCVCALFLIFPTLAEAKKRILIADINGLGIQNHDRTQLKGTLYQSVSELAGIEALLFTMADRADRARNCVETNHCRLSMMKQRKADFLLSTKLSGLGSTFRFELKLYPLDPTLSPLEITERGKRGSTTFRQVLVVALKRIFDQAGLKRPGSLLLTNLAVGSEVTIDGKSFGTVYSHTQSFQVSPGRHSILVSMPGMASFFREQDIHPGKTESIRVELRPLPARTSSVASFEDTKQAVSKKQGNKKRWYKKWWVWSIIGSAVVTGTVLAFTLTGDDGGNATNANVIDPGGGDDPTEPDDPTSITTTVTLGP